MKQQKGDGKFLAQALRSIAPLIPQMIESAVRDYFQQELSKTVGKAARQVIRKTAKENPGMQQVQEVCREAVKQAEQRVQLALSILLKQGGGTGKQKGEQNPFTDDSINSRNSSNKDVRMYCEYCKRTSHPSEHYGCEFYYGYGMRKELVNTERVTRKAAVVGQRVTQNAEGSRSIVRVTQTREKPRPAAPKPGPDRD